MRNTRPLVQVGQLYVWGYLRRMEPSAAHIHALEGSALLAPCFRSPAFIAHTGGSASGSSAPTLPTFALPSLAPAAGCALRPLQILVRLSVYIRILVFV